MPAPNPPSQRAGAATGGGEGLGQGEGGPGSPPIPGGGCMLPKPLCVSNKPSPAPLLSSASSPRSHVRAAPGTSHPIPARGGGTGSPSTGCSRGPPAPSRVLGCPAARGRAQCPEMRLWAAPRRAGCSMRIQTHSSPKPATDTPVCVPRSSPTAPLSPERNMHKSCLGSDTGTALGCQRGGDIPLEVPTRWDR